nr:MAG TPA: hypothetical protein [Caudoviricetes sp.]
MSFYVHKELPPRSNWATAKPVSKERAAFHAMVHANPGMWVSATLEDLRPNHGITDKTALVKRARTIAGSIRKGVAPFNDDYFYEAASRDCIIYVRVLTEDMVEGVGDETQG